MFVNAVQIVFIGHAALTLRSRLRCIVMRKQDKTGGDDKVFSSTIPESDATLVAGKGDNSPKTNLLVLNEVKRGTITNIL